MGEKKLEEALQNGVPHTFERAGSGPNNHSKTGSYLVSFRFLYSIQTQQLLRTFEITDCQIRNFPCALALPQSRGSLVAQAFWFR